MKEIWKKINDYNYEVSSLGRIRNIKTNRILKNIKTVHGYEEVSLRKDNKAKIYKVHRLVAIAFIDNPENKAEVNHIDGKKNNNSLENLEWVTRNENQIHSYKVLNNKDKSKKQVFQIDKNTGKLVNVFADAYIAQRLTNIKQQNINSCALGKLKSAGGYIWKYNL